MSDFKITGNPNPVIGKEEFYSIGNPVAKTFPYTAMPKSPFDTPVLWTVHILENGRWRKTKENDKRGDKVSYTFLQRSLGRKGIRIMATRGDQTARLDIDTHPAERPKIDSIELLDKSGKKPAKPLSYGQMLKARVHCLHMERRKIYVTLWEDDANGAGHNKENEKNIIETRFGFVEDGIADVDFFLKPTFAKIATKGGAEKDKTHEYYVTTNFDNEKLASKNVNVNELKTPVAPFKGKVPVQQPAKNNAPAQQPKAQSTATPAQTKPKGAISSVKITDADGNAIKGVYRDKQIKVWIYSTGLAGKEIRLKLYDEDYVSNDILVDQKFTITKDIFPIIVTLNKIPRSRGGDTGEGAEQEVFADVEVLESNKHTVSAVVDVDAKAFKPDPVEATNNVMKIGKADKKDGAKEKSKCYCNKDFEEKDVKSLVKLLKGSETIWEGVALKGGKRAECNISDKTFATLTKALNNSFKKYNINTCAKKMHFLAQVCEETGTFTLSEEITGQHASSKSIYKGRGLLQLTGVRKKDEELYNDPGPYKDYADYIGDQNVIKNPDVVANNANYCIDSGAWIWSINKKMPSDSKSQAVKKWGTETAGKSLNELAVFGDKYLELISVLLNGRNKENGNMPNGWEKRKSMYNLLKTAFFKYNWYHGNNSKPVTTKDVVTYHIYENGKMERHIPKKIESGFEKKYKYVYHDKNSKEHEICIVDWLEIDKVKREKPNPSSIPKGYISHESFNISGVNQKDVYKYSDGSVIASGDAGEGGGTIRLKFAKIEGKAILVKLPDPLNYNSGNLKIALSFENTIRKYMGRNHFAGLIGALAECGLSLVSEGSAMKDGTCFPSVSHTNGESIDSDYFNLENTQKYVDAMAKFGFTSFYYKPGMELEKPSKAKVFEEDSHHKAHLHCGVTQISITEIKE